MSIFTPAENTSAFLKMGLFGEAGSGKTYTAADTAIGLILYMRKLQIPQASKPALFLDTETGVDWIAPKFKDANIQLEVAKSRAFAKLVQAVKDGEAQGSVLIVDSITHFWKELCDSYLQQKSERIKKRARLEFQDWAYLKGEWSKFTDLFVNSNIHIILCGRLGYDYNFTEDDEGHKQLEKTGVKMKAESEMGYEPSLLVQMVRRQKLDGKGVEATWREGTVVKDRSTLLDGQEFINPKFSNFLPHIERLNLGGKQLGVDTTAATHHDLGPTGRDNSSIQRKIVLGEIQDLLILHVPGQAAADKQRKVALVKKHFKAGWVECEEVMPLSDLRVGYDGLHRELEGVPSRYASAIEREKPVALNDELPAHSAPPAQPTQSLKDKLLAEIETLPTMDACLEWAIKTSADYGDFDGNGAVYAALLKRQGLIGSGASLSKLKEPAPDSEQNPPSPPPAARNGSGGGLNLLEAG